MSKERTHEIISEIIIQLVDRRDCWFLWSIADIDSFMKLICFHFELKSRILFSRRGMNNSGLFSSEKG